jgi:hypothetical protein
MEHSLTWALLHHPDHQLHSSTQTCSSRISELLREDIPLQMGRDVTDVKVKNSDKPNLK